MALSPDIERYKAKLQREPHSLVFAQLADAYRKGGMLDEAIRVCRRGLKHHPNYASAYMVLGRTHLEKGDLLEAREAFQQALRLSPDNVLAYRLLGQIAAARGEVEAAAGAYRTALELNPFDQEVRTALERLEATVAPREEPSREAPPPGPPGFATETLGDLYASQGLISEALETYEEVLATAPDREELQRKYRDLSTRLEHEAPPLPPPVTVRDPAHELLERLEAWRQAFQALRAERGGGG